MDLLDLKPKDTIEIFLKHPSGSGEALLMPDDTPMSVTIHTPYSQKYKEALYEQSDKRLKKASSNKNVKMTSSDLEKASLELTVAVVHDWKIYFGGKSVPFSKATATEVLTALPWISNQISEGLNDQSDFFTS